MPDYGNVRSSTRRGWWDRVWSKIDAVLAGLEAAGLRFDEEEWLDEPKPIPAVWISDAKSKARGAADALSVTWKNNDFDTYSKARDFAADLKKGYDEWRAGHEAEQEEEEQGEEQETPAPQHTLRIQAPNASTVRVKLLAGNKWVAAAQSPISGEWIILLPAAYQQKIIVKAAWPNGTSVTYPPAGSINVAGPTTLRVEQPAESMSGRAPAGVKIRPNLQPAGGQDTVTPMATATVSAPGSSRLSVRRVVTGGMEVLPEVPDTAEDTIQASVPMGSVLEARASWVDGSSTVQVISVDGDKVVVLAQEALPVEVIVAEVEVQGEVPELPAPKKWYRRPSTWLLLGAGGLAVAFGRRAVAGRRDALMSGDYDCGCGG